MQSREQIHQIFWDLTQLWQIVHRRHTLNIVHGEQRVLHYLMQCGGQAQPSELSQALHVSTARIAAVLGSLERKEEIIRIPQPADRRCVQVQITASGRAHLQQVCDQMIAQMQAVLDALGPQDAQVFVRIIHRLPEIVSQLDEQKGEN